MREAIDAAFIQGYNQTKSGTHPGYKPDEEELKQAYCNGRMARLSDKLLKDGYVTSEHEHVFQGRVRMSTRYDAAASAIYLF